MAGGSGRCRLRRVASTLCIAALVGGVLASAAVSAPAVSAVTYQDWPMFLQNSSRTAATVDPNLTAAEAPLLKLKWSLRAGGPIAASASVVGTSAYVGAWDGDEYAVNTNTGAVIWKQFIGQDVDANCAPETLGVTSTATVVNGVVYVGGGDGYWYALDAGTGAVLWKVFTGDTSQGYYNWSSPLIVGNDAYIGTASNCDEPLTRGSLLKLDLTTHTVVATYYFVPPGQIGGGVWTSPTYDATTNTVFVSTGTLDDPSQTQSQALVALDATTLAYKSSWQLPAFQAIGDADWGATPTLITDPAGDQLLAAANKNGILYVLDRNNLAAGPVWEHQIAIPGACPTCGDGSISSGVFANGVLYYAGGHALQNGHGSGGSISAFDPATGNLLWTRQTDSSIIGAPAYVSGMVAYAEGSTFEVVDATNGKLLYSYALHATVVAAVSLARSQFYVGGLDGGLYAFGLGAAPTAPPADPNCPSGFACRDIGSHAAGSQSSKAGVLTVTASGTAITGAADQFRSIGQAVIGDSQSSVTVAQQSSQSTPAQAGLMVRQQYGSSTDVGSPFFAVLASPNDVVNGSKVADVSVWYRSVYGKAPVRIARRVAANRPVSLMIQRSGNLFSAGISFDGVHFQLIPGGSARVDLPATTLQGLAVNSGSSTVKGTAGFTNL
ncbi:MAG TPA: PQQ-binding-like beta-propeller repeat protein, partial [Acidimicrobiia bacterium]